MANLSIAVIAYNSEDCIAGCLAAATGFSADVIVIDNASQDGTRRVVAQFPSVRLIANPDNRGFAEAVNQGLRAAAYPAVLILNPDAWLLDDPEPLAAAALAPGYGAAAGALCGEDGRPQVGFSFRRLPSPAALIFELLWVNRLFPANPVNRRYRCLDCDVDIVQDVEQPAGAFLAVNRQMAEATGGFDTRFHPIWFEDVDFCLRLLKSGAKIRYIPAVRAVHRGASSIRKLAPLDRQVHWYVSLLKYAGKHFNRFAAGMVRVAAVLSFVPRTLYTLAVSPRFLNRATAQAEKHLDVS